MRHRFRRRRADIARWFRRAAGIEPASDFDGTAETPCDCVKCKDARAAQALHLGRSNWLDLSSIDADLLTVVLAWEKISEPIRKAIVSLVESSR